jgi:pimeloyl-ACP methyl ester carboxylesterase
MGCEHRTEAQGVHRGRIHAGLLRVPRDHVARGVCGCLGWVMTLALGMVPDTGGRGRRSGGTDGDRQDREGTIEIGRAGAGPPVLFVHGAPGGADSSLAMGQFLVSAGFEVIAPPRPGYLGTRWPAAARSTSRPTCWRR